MNSQLCPYEANTYMEQSPTNLSIGELRSMDDEAFWQWAEEFRRKATHAWDVLGVPIIGGRNADHIVEDFKALARYDVSDFRTIDELTGQADCIHNTATVGATCNQFFPTMLKTRDITKSQSTGTSIYMLISEPGLLPAFVKAMKRLLCDDKLGFFSSLVPQGNLDATDWLRSFRQTQVDDFWLSATDKRDRRWLTIADNELRELVDAGVLSADRIVGAGPYYKVRRFDPTKRLMKFPKIFRHLMDGTPATNFRPLTAKHLYLHFTRHIPKDEPVVVYDPSAGWGGRILGAMACCNERQIHYVGTDPNPDHQMPDLHMTKYEYLADYFNGNVRGKYRNTYEIFDIGSEEIGDCPVFEEYRGKVDFIFTSPPYFAAEGYSDDENQSYNKFPTYDSWLHGFLKPTLETGFYWLREDRYICLNIADIRLDGKVFPLQQDAKDILLNMGMAYLGNLKMVMPEAPGGSKETDAGVPRIRNFCRIKGKRRKYEPILVFQKLIDPFGTSPGHERWGDDDEEDLEDLEEVMKKFIIDAKGPRSV